MKPGWALWLGLAALGCGTSAAHVQPRARDDGSRAATMHDRELKLFGNGGSDLSHAGRGALRVIWRKELTPTERGNYKPVENAVAAIDPEHQRVYVGAGSGHLHALGFDGRPLYRFELHEPIESEPALDARADELYVGTERGDLYALTPSNGKIRWKMTPGAAVRQRPVLYRDALYVLTEEDLIEGRSRADGSVLWSYRRERSEGFLVAGHAGMVLTDDGRIITAFNDGTVVALDALDGHAKWERSTADDVPDAEPGRPRYLDTDATPVLMGEFVYAASFGGGLYCLDQRNGSVVWREPEWTGVTGLAATDDGGLIIVSADRGVARFDIATRLPTWIKKLERGSFGTPEVRDGLVLLGDSKGSLVALDTRSGDELGRIEAGHGFVARAAVTEGHGFILSNSGVLLALNVARLLP
ncbi:MAG: putative cell surface protein [Myxococcaceae bacterium]|nr:putative cell surface protein [Myxococcaceae bacterium]